LALLRLSRPATNAVIPFLHHSRALSFWLVRAKELVLADWQKTLFLRSESPETRGWLLDVMKCVESLGKRDFTLEDIYAFERHFGDLYPGNQNVKPKIRQQLQYLRDRGFIDFVSRGNYRLRS
jgi:hypothetical protein